jgi:uncharacterized protein YbjT (DUF2867 family)
MQKLLFIGASGMLGKPVALELIRSGFQLTLLARDVEKVEKLFPKIHVVKGDVFDMGSLEAAMKGHEIVYLNLSVAQTSKKSDLQPEREGIKNIIEAAKKTEIKRIAYLSSLVKNYEGMNGFSWWSFEIKRAAVDAIKRSGLNYSIFYASTFMECLDQQMLQGSRLMLVGKSEAPMWFVAGKDFGRQVAWALKKAGGDNQEYPIQGSEAFTWDQAAKVFCDNYKVPVKPMKAPLAPLKFLGLFNQRINYAYHICEAMNKYPEKFESENAWDDLGKPTITLADYAASLKR